MVGGEVNAPPPDWLLPSRIAWSRGDKTLVTAEFGPPSPPPQNLQVNLCAFSKERRFTNFGYFWAFLPHFPVSTDTNAKLNKFLGVGVGAETDGDFGSSQ